MVDERCDARIGNRRLMTWERRGATRDRLPRTQGLKDSRTDDAIEPRAGPDRVRGGLGLPDRCGRGPGGVRQRRLVGAAAIRRSRLRRAGASPARGPGIPRPRSPRSSAARAFPARLSPAAGRGLAPDRRVGAGGPCGVRRVHGRGDPGGLVLVPPDDVAGRGAPARAGASGQLALCTHRRRDPVRAAVPAPGPGDDPRRGTGRSLGIRPANRRRCGRPRRAAGRLPADSPRRHRPGDGRGDRHGATPPEEAGPGHRDDRRPAGFPVAGLDGERRVGRAHAGGPDPPGEGPLARAGRRSARLLHPAHPRPGHRPVRRGRNRVPAQSEGRHGRECVGGGGDGRHRLRVGPHAPPAAAKTGRAGRVQHAAPAARLAVHRGRPASDPADPVHPGRRGRGGRDLLGLARPCRRSDRCSESTLRAAIIPAPADRGGAGPRGLAAVFGLCVGCGQGSRDGGIAARFRRGLCLACRPGRPVRTGADPPPGRSLLADRPPGGSRSPRPSGRGMPMPTPTPSRG